MKKSELAERLFLEISTSLKPLFWWGWQREFQFCPIRKWRFDFAHPNHKLAVEVQGGTFTGGRHSRGAAMMEEYEKLNTAAIMGWRVLFFDSRMILPPREHRGPARTAAEARRRELEGCAIEMIWRAMQCGS